MTTKTKTKHTAGPWTIPIQSLTSETYVAVALNTADCAEVRGLNAWANARLIAAAPELLELLKRGRNELHKNVYETGQPGSWATKLDDAIADIEAKAEGGKQNDQK